MDLFGGSSSATGPGSLGSLGLGSPGGFGGGLDSVPPELQQALSTLENMDERVAKFSVPLLKLQYTCGFKSCFQDKLGTWGASSAGGANDTETLSCLERCEAPMVEFSQACENRLDGLMNRVTQCFMGGEEGSAEKCVRQVLAEGNMRKIEDEISSDVHTIYSKYSTNL
eukprot:g7744.t1